MTNKNTAATAPATPVAKKAAAKKAPAKPAVIKAPAPVTEPTVLYDLDTFRTLKKESTDALNALMYDARLKRPKGSATPEEAVAKVNALIASYREWVRLVAEAATPLEVQSN
ncbi:hypothetical protein [Nocardioides sp. Root140]|uniref:hypothetical protein n=1 Tax=Nocardioides sp. Root140 TaxID=1736460 RepID=UPI0006FC58AC|nr:hypothetical protein [Nocardioides sp. Root140]KQY61828.1 hypothetical protein ASD30_25130 [Nocardioides sp. Root140]